MDYIHFVSIYPDQPENHKKEPQQVAARLLAHEGSYYAYYYNARTGIGDVDLFIFAPKERRFVIVNQNT